MDKEKEKDEKNYCRAVKYTLVIVTIIISRALITAIVSIVSINTHQLFGFEFRIHFYFQLHQWIVFSCKFQDGNQPLRLRGLVPFESTTKNGSISDNRGTILIYLRTTWWIITD